MPSAAASERLRVLVMGTNDLAKELHAEHVTGRAPLLTGLVPRPYGCTRGTGRYFGRCLQRRHRIRTGFEADDPPRPSAWLRRQRPSSTPGRWRLCNRMFAPAPEEAERKPRRIIGVASKRPWPTGAGWCPVDGRMIENLHVDQARRVLAAWPRRSPVAVRRARCVRVVVRRYEGERAAVPLPSTFLY